MYDFPTANSLAMISSKVTFGFMLSGQMVFAKQPLPANLFLRVDQLWRQLQHRRCAAIVGHVRFATHGSPTEPANNHPFVSKGLAVVHNGVLNNHRELADRHNLRLVGECDSEVILRMSARLNC